MIDALKRLFKEKRIKVNYGTRKKPAKVFGDDAIHKFEVFQVYIDGDKVYEEEFNLKIVDCVGNPYRIRP